jgi:hypothetical protein
MRISRTGRAFIIGGALVLALTFLSALADAASPIGSRSVWPILGLVAGGTSVLIGFLFVAPPND